MGTTARLFVHGGPADLAERLTARLGRLEERWSRFIESSEVSALNRDAGQMVPVSDDTLLLVQRAVSASRRTAGWFDPTLLGALVDAGYDRSFEQLDTWPVSALDLVLTVRPGTGAEHPTVELRDWNARSRQIRVDARAGTVGLPAGARFDPGGIGKGLAADLVVADALRAGATAVLVDLGGDIACGGRAPDGGWAIDIEDPTDPATATCSIRIPSGAVATSSRVRRQWRHEGASQHHLIDPTTGAPSTSDAVACTVVAGACWLAEAYAKAAVLAGVEAGLGVLRSGAVEGLITGVDGTVHRSPAMTGVAP